MEPVGSLDQQQQQQQQNKRCIQKVFFFSIYFCSIACAQMPYNTIFISVTGAIGSGKSTLIEAWREDAKKRCRPVAEEDTLPSFLLPYTLRAVTLTPSSISVDMLFCPEFIDAVASPEEIESSLRDFYTGDMARWALTLQFQILARQIDTYGHIPKQTQYRPLIVICERCPWDGCHVFLHMQCKTGIVTKKEYDLYSWYYRYLAWEPHATFYVRTATPEQCIERVRQRASCHDEDAIDPDYLRRIWMTYETQMKHCTRYIDNALVPFCARTMTPQLWVFLEHELLSRLE
jgi:deoxyadenosine/deoxycytidine kinase